MFGLDSVCLRPPKASLVETITESIYDHPRYYDLVFGTDCAAELKFVRAVNEKYLGGKDGLIGWFVGQVMQKSQGKANPNMAREILLEIFSEK